MSGDSASVPASVDAAPAPRRLCWWLRWLLCMGGGAFMSLAFPPADISVFVWVGLIPLLAVIWREQASFWRSFRAGWLYGMGWYCTSFWWIQEVGKVFDIPYALFLGIAFLPLMALYSLLPALWAALAATLLRPRLERGPATRDAAAWNAWARADLFSTLRSALGCAALWVCIEWLRAHGTLGFSWNSLGTALYDGLSLAQWAEFVGSTALAFIPVATTVVLYGSLRRTVLQFKGMGRGCRPWDFYGAVVVLFILFAAGMALSTSYSAGSMLRRDSVMALPVMAVQLNQDQRDRIAEGRGGTVQDGMYLRETMAAFHDIQRKTAQRAMASPEVGVVQQLPLWVVWPESAMGYPFLLDASSQQRLPDRLNAASLFAPSGLPAVRSQVRDMGGQPFVLFTGVDELLLRPGSLRAAGMLNTMAAIPGDGFEGIVSASKQHLMPFGEYIPLAEDIEWIARTYSEITGTQVSEGIHPGEGSEPLTVSVPGTDESVGVIPAVCYEDTVGDLLTKFVRRGPQVIVNVTNDGWFGDSSCGLQQARAAAFRCIELRRPMVRAANKGLCCAIAPNGAVLDSLKKGDGSPQLAGYSYSVLPVDRNAGLTLYARFGDWAVLLCALLSVGLAVRGWLRRRAA